MAEKNHRVVKAYQNIGFLKDSDARSLRILSEYLEPQSRLSRFNIVDTIVFMGSARIIPPEQAEAELEAAKEGHGDVERAELRLEMSHYYEAASDLAERLTSWSKELNGTERRFIVCTGGGPGIMAAANRGASRARGLNIGMAISIPEEQLINPYVTRDLAFQFHYFFMRKFWLVYLAKAVIFFPGGFGTLDELFELLTLLKTEKIRKHLPVVLFGKKYWDEVINFDALIKYSNVDPGDRNLVFSTDSVEDAYTYLTDELTKFAMGEKGVTL
ncbi:MAG: LOG family protein [Thermoleophilia bacterium]|nr:LOG family protein [Thermoleophilia bacterium]